MTIRLMIADDHGIFRSGLRALLEQEGDIEVVGKAENGDEAIEMAVEKQPDVIMMDISMPGISGIEATRRIYEQVPSAKVLILTIHEDKFMAQEALSAGAKGYILKKALKDDVLNAIHTVMRNEIYLHASMAKLLFEDSLPSEEEDPMPSQETLTPRELEVLKFIAHGYTNKQTAKFLNISVRTVEYHRGNITSKLNTHSRVKLMQYAEDAGLM